MRDQKYRAFTQGTFKREWQVICEKNGRTISPAILKFTSYGETAINPQWVAEAISAFDGINDPMDFMKVVKGLRLDAYKFAQEDIRSLTSQRDVLLQQVLELEKLAHEIVTVNCKGHVAPAWRGKINAILGIGAGGGA